MSDSLGRFLSRYLTTERAHTLEDLMLVTGYTRRALQYALRGLIERDLVARWALVRNDGGTAPAVYMRTTSLAGVRLPDKVLLLNARPRMVSANKEANRRQKLHFQELKRRRDAEQAERYPHLQGRGRS